MDDLKAYSDEQRDAIALAVDKSNRIASVIGEAGTGKTTILAEVYDQLSDHQICLAAPTGRAAKRISEATNLPAVTIHKMMRFTRPESDDDLSLPAHDKNNPLPYDVIICDESSMINEELYRAIIDAMKPGSMVRFFGDPNQLPPVKGVSPFHRLIQRWPTAKLTHNYRADDGVVTAARGILRGHIPASSDYFQLISMPGELTASLAKLINKDYLTDKYQIISPQNVGKYGTRAINSYVQTRYNLQPRGYMLSYTDEKKDEKVLRQFRINDKIIWTKNDYRLNLFNGMIGYIEEFDDEGHFQIQIDGKSKLIPPVFESYDPVGRAIFSYDPRKSIDLAYAITTHKAQGSEFEQVLLILTRSAVMERANFYTAVTRAKNKCIVLAAPGGIAAGMKKRSLLTERGL